jgi:hypothetical protein
MKMITIELGMGAKFGSAATTWWPSASRHRTTHSLFVEGFQQDRGRRSPAECFGETLGFGADPALDHLAALGQDADRAFPLGQIDAKMVHGWSPSPCATERVISLWGTLCHHVESGVSGFIQSTLSARG